MIPVDIREKRQSQSARWQVPSRRDVHWEREQQLVTQRVLLERLRVRWYERRGTFGMSPFPWFRRLWAELTS